MEGESAEKEEKAGIHPGNNDFGSFHGVHCVCVYSCIYLCVYGVPLLSCEPQQPSSA